MNIIKQIFKNLSSKTELVQLGRWKLDYCNTKINRKIDLSNEDHCGPCGNYVINKKLDIISTVNKELAIIPTVNKQLAILPIVNKDIVFIIKTKK